MGQQGVVKAKEVVQHGAFESIEVAQGGEAKVGKADWQGRTRWQNEA